MFEGIKRRWAEARAHEAAKGVYDILQRYELMDPLNRRLVTSAFQAMMSELVNQSGPLSGLQKTQREEIAKQIMEAARSALKQRGDGVYAETSRVSSYGAALLSLYLELQTLPGDRAMAVVAAIERWEKDAAE